MSKKLINACEAGNLKKVEKLLNRIFLKLDVNCKNLDGRTPMHLASISGHKELVELLISKGADVNFPDNDGNTPLHFASEKGHKEISEILIANSADVNASTSNGATPLHYASLKAHKEISEILIANNVDVNFPDNDGDTPLHYSSFRSDTELAEMLIIKGAKVNVQNKDGKTPLFEAASRGYEEKVKLLISKGADVNIQTIYGTTPLSGASNYGNIRIVELLINKGAQILDDYILFSAAHEGYAEVVKLLLDRGAKTNVLDASFKSPLDKALNRKHRRIIELLTEKGAKSGEEIRMTDAIIDNGDGTLTDTYSGFMWQKDDDGVLRTQFEAFDYCSSLNLGGFSDWRLPYLDMFKGLKKTAKYCSLEVNTIYSPNGNVYWTADDPPPGFPNNVAYTADGTTFYRSNKYYVKAARVPEYWF